MNEEPKFLVAEEEVRTFIQRPVCPACAKKGVKRYLIMEEGKVVLDNSPPMAKWACDACQHTVNLPPGAFPSFEHRQVDISKIVVQRPKPQVVE